MLVKSELYYKVGIGICITSTIAGLITGVIGAWWGFLQVIVSAGIGLFFYRDLRKLQALTEAGETADKRAVFFEETEEEKTAKRQAKELREEVRRMGIPDEDVKIKSTMFGVIIEPKSPEAREKLLKLSPQLHTKEDKGESKNSADK